ncbi:protein kinase domain-containing protein [Actinomadura fibrosa]|uniref:non-specific serine/threonine protein kinase n=1 Tax=Actinomadura fibrosa TaxID=111802 RepID=A0ABW2XT34_9ACTN|nr:cellulose binding domain-containing protein [Actinomadura fibrosa]
MSEIVGPGDRLGDRYVLEEPAGSGGMATVWRAVDSVLDRSVAVKVPRGDWTEESSRRLLREAQAAAGLAHPSITGVYDYGEHGRVPYVVMELLNGETLAARLARGPLPWREAAGVCARVADALAAAHAAGVVHRDIKPANVVLTPVGVKVLDFGIAFTGPATGAGGPLLGTPAYVAPELLDGAEPSAAADLFSLGVVLRTALLGGPPSADPAGLDGPDAIAADVPADVADLCRRCLAPDPADRPSAAEAAEALASAAGIELAPFPHAADPPPADADPRPPRADPATKILTAPEALGATEAEAAEARAAEAETEVVDAPAPPPAPAAPPPARDEPVPPGASGTTEAVPQEEATEVLDGPALPVAPAAASQPGATRAERRDPRAKALPSAAPHPSPPGALGGPMQDGRLPGGTPLGASGPGSGAAGEAHAGAAVPGDAGLGGGSARRPLIIVGVVVGALVLVGVLLAALAPDSSRSASPAPPRRGPASPQASPSASRTAAAVPCRVSYAINGSWPEGFQATVRITNLGDGALDGWRLAFTLPDGQRITQIWNGGQDADGAAVTVTAADWNRSIPPQGTVEFGFLGHRDGGTGRPERFTLNGTECRTG